MNSVSVGMVRIDSFLFLISRSHCMQSPKIQDAILLMISPPQLVMIDGDRLWTPTLEQHTSNGDDTIPTEPMTIDETGTDTEDDLESEGSHSGDRASDCPGETTILRFVPTDANVLDTMYAALAECQALNPDISEDLSPSDLEDVDEEDDEDDAENGYIRNPDQFADD
ncbi:hypothetical protein AHF37_01011 [Paragonimus kellicotti]|nr:hypothetical protein AHF37_01011 [Paragonimus kellicotti]